MFRLRRLRLRSVTERTTYGADLAFADGLNILWADNTMGKSTCMQAVIYALGLERMLSPRRETPLPYVMTSYVPDAATSRHFEVLQSRVELELMNTDGHVITVVRPVVGGADKRLISVLFGPALSAPSGDYSQRDYFVRDPGAAQREAGFHHMLTEFLGWELPVVRKYDGTEVPLYLETLFPLFYVEQKAGWSTLPAAFPTYLQIRDVSQRAVEFILGLETHDLELRRLQLAAGLAATQAQWQAAKDHLASVAALLGARVEAVPAQPTAEVSDLGRIHLSVLVQNLWISLNEWLASLRSQAEGLRSQQVPTVTEAAPQVSARIAELLTAVQQLNARRSALFRSKQAQRGEGEAIRKRLAALREDLQKNVDAQKLKNLGSTLANVLAAEQCPTCSQPIDDALLGMRVANEVMPIDENIEYISAQRMIFERLIEQTGHAEAALERELLIVSAEIEKLNLELRTLREESVAPGTSPSVSRIEERVRLEAQIELIRDVQTRFAEGLLRMEELSAEQRRLLAAKASLPNQRLTDADKDKLSSLTRLVREQLALYGFGTFRPSELEISEDNFRPQKEGFEIGFEVSASDAIRLKWAYQLALLELDREKDTNHPGILFFDEPRQQEASRISLSNLLKRAASAKQANQQVIFATSEDRHELDVLLASVESHLISFEGPILRPVSD